MFENSTFFSKQYKLDAAADGELLASCVQVINQFV